MECGDLYHQYYATLIINKALIKVETYFYSSLSN